MSETLFFLHQLTHNTRTDCSLNYKFNTWKFQAQNMGRTCCVQKLFLTFRTIYVHNMFSPCSTNIRAPDKDLHVCTSFLTFRSFEFRNFWFTMVYNILFSSPLVLLSNLNLPGFCFRVFLCVPHINNVNRGMPVQWLCFGDYGYHCELEKSPWMGEIPFSSHKSNFLSWR